MAPHDVFLRSGTRHMSRNLAFVLLVLALVPACAGKDGFPSPAEMMDRYWKAKLRELPPKSSAATIESFLRANGAQSVNRSTDGLRVVATQSRTLKRYFPPWDLEICVEIQCELDSSDHLKSCNTSHSP